MCIYCEGHKEEHGNTDDSQTVEETNEDPGTFVQLRNTVFDLIPSQN